MNVFEGARRIALIIAVLSGIAGVIGIFNIEPYVQIHYRIPFFESPLIKVEQCESGDASHSAPHKTPKGHDFRIRVCFAPGRANSGKMLIPYAQSAIKGQVYMDSEYSDEVRQYMSLITEANYRPSAADFIDADNEFIRLSIVDRVKGAGWLLLGIVCFWIFVCAVGWIVRGFAGIPAGADRKAVPPEVGK